MRVAAILLLALTASSAVPVADVPEMSTSDPSIDLNAPSAVPMDEELHTSHDAADAPSIPVMQDPPAVLESITDESRLDTAEKAPEASIQPASEVSEEGAKNTEELLNGSSLITYHNYPRGTDQGEHDLPLVRHPGLIDDQVNLQAGLTVMRSAEGTVKPITEHIQGQMLQTLRKEQEAGTDAQDQYNSDPWAVYGGERSLFCRIQYYHDTVEFSPSCELVDFNLVDPEYHKPRFNCQFFEQRGILYFYGERWMDCTPLSQRGKKVVFECGQMCAKREGQTDLA